MENRELSALAEAIAGRIFVELEASGRHVHVTAQQALALFGHPLTPKRPLSQPVFTQSLRLLCGTRERLRGLEKKNATIEEKMEEIRLVNRAKWLLIEELNMTEQEAHRYIEKQAMDRCVTKRAVAEQILSTYK